MKRFLVFLVLFAGVVVGGGLYAKHTATQVIGSEVIREINSPAGQQAIHQVLANPQVQTELKKYSSSPGATQFSNRQAVINYAVSKLSPGEMAQFANDYVHRDTLSEAQKTQIEAEVLSKFTPQQLAAMAKAFNN